MEKLTLTMKPFWENDTVARMQIRVSFDAADLPEKAPELEYCAEGFVGLCPFSGAFSLILPQNPVRFRLSLIWNMSEMPDDARAVWSYGNGNVEKEMSAWNVRFTFYGVGRMQAAEDGGFGIYWFSKPEFEVEATTERLVQLFRYMREFFRDKEPTYKIFLRRDPFKISGGGSGAGKAFISGYSAFGGMDVKRWLNVLAHEMVYNWPCMDMKIPGYGTWYSEGTAEYYSTVLPYRVGLRVVSFCGG